ncbi:MAG: ankyrin repeat domain-containing protein, partial [Desulfomonilaceae bacterium]
MLSVISWKKNPKPNHLQKLKTKTKPKKKPDNSLNYASKNGDGDSALILAVKNGHPAVVSTLISNGADVELKDKKGKT